MTRGQLGAERQRVHTALSAGEGRDETGMRGDALTKAGNGHHVASLDHVGCRHERWKRVYLLPPGLIGLTAVGPPLGLPKR